MQPFILSSRHPIVKCLLIGFIIIFAVYLFIFIEVDGMNIYALLTQKRSSRSLHQYDIFQTPGNQLPALKIQSDPQQQQSFNLESDDYFKMFEHIHNTPFADLSPTLQTRHLQELVRFDIISMMHRKQEKGIMKKAGQRELLIHLNQIYAQHGSGVNFVQIGACDGNFDQSNDPIQNFILQNEDWHGVMLEPVPYLFDTLLQNMDKTIKSWKDRILPLNAALSDHDGYQTFHIVNHHFAEEMPNETHALKFQIGSFNKEHIVKHLVKKKDRNQLSEELDHYIDAINVSTLSAQSVVKTYKESEMIVRDGAIDVLTIDAEGYDYVVLKGFIEHTAIRPLMVIFEHLHLSIEDKAASIKLLHNYGYIDFEEWWNTIGIRLSNL